MQNLQQENRQRGKSALKMGGISVQEHNIVIPGISLCQKWGKIRIFHSTIVALGEPKYIRFLFNPEKRGISLNELRSSIIKLGDGITFEIFRIAIDRNYIESIFCIGIVRR